MICHIEKQNTFRFTNNTTTYHTYFFLCLFLRILFSKVFSRIKINFFFFLFYDCLLNFNEIFDYCPIIECLFTFDRRRRRIWNQIWIGGTTYVFFSLLSMLGKEFKIHSYKREKKEKSKKKF